MNPTQITIMATLLYVALVLALAWATRNRD